MTLRLDRGRSQMAYCEMTMVNCPIGVEQTRTLFQPSDRRAEWDLGPGTEVRSRYFYKFVPASCLLLSSPTSLLLFQV
jgi:hypothetical protein